MTDFEMIKQLYKRNHIIVYIADTFIDDEENEITYWFNTDGSLDWIQNYKSE